MSIRYNFESASTPKRIPEYIVPEFAEGLNSKRMAEMIGERALWNPMNDFSYSRAVEWKALDSIVQLTQIANIKRGIFTSPKLEHSFFRLSVLCNNEILPVCDVTKRQYSDYESIGFYNSPKHLGIDHDLTPDQKMTVLDMLLSIGELSDRPPVYDRPPVPPIDK